jgi:predicted O-methyltransferase YrrM
MTTFNKKLWRTIKGFMDEAEADALYRVALDASKNGPVLEIGSYCGKSAYVIGSACKVNRSVLFSVDHHRGSEEQQPGEEYFDPQLYDEKLSRINTVPYLQETLALAGLENVVLPILGISKKVGTFWKTPLSMVFIDGGHTFEAAFTDYEIWSGHIRQGGYLVFHDIFFDPEKGGQAPRQVYETALSSGLFEQIEMVNTLGILKRS